MTGEHEAYLRSVSSSVVPLELAEPPAPGVVAVPEGWLIVHSGPVSEIIELVDYAREMAGLEGVRPRLTLVSPCRPDGLPHGVAHLDVYPAWPFFATAERVITAVGCNVVRQLARWPERHRMIAVPAPLRRPVHARRPRAHRHRLSPGVRSPLSGRAPPPDS